MAQNSNNSSEVKLAAHVQEHIDRTVDKYVNRFFSSNRRLF